MISEEERTMLEMQNNEQRRKIFQLQKDNQDIRDKQVTTSYSIDQIYNELFIQNDSMKLYDKTIRDLKRAIKTEKTCLKTL